MKITTKVEVKDAPRASLSWQHVVDNPGVYKYVDHYAHVRLVSTKYGVVIINNELSSFNIINGASLSAFKSLAYERADDAVTITFQN